MLNDMLARLGALWARISPRERRLALLTGGVILFFAVFTMAGSARENLRMLDNTIYQMQDTIVSYTDQMARKGMVEELYAKVAAQHSSAWSEAEIHDRLRQEIYRLARREPQQLDERGIPLNEPNQSGNLVEIPSLGKGEMTRGGEGYRQYMINLRIPDTDIASLVDFLERLQQSPQALRIDSLEINRMPESSRVAASINITRTIADGSKTASVSSGGGGAAVSSPESADAEGGPGQTGKIPLSASDWTVKGCEAKLLENEGGRPQVEITALESGAAAELPRKLPPGGAFEMYVEAASSGPAKLAVAVAGGGANFPDAAEMRDDNLVYRYHVQFTVPEGGGDRVACPRFVLPEKGVSVRVQTLLLRKLSE